MGIKLGENIIRNAYIDDNKFITGLKIDDKKIIYKTDESDQYLWLDKFNQNSDSKINGNKVTLASLVSDTYVPPIYDQTVTFDNIIILFKGNIKCKDSSAAGGISSLRKDSYIHIKRVNFKSSSMEKIATITIKTNFWYSKEPYLGVKASITINGETEEIPGNYGSTNEGWKGEDGVDIEVGYNTTTGKFMLKIGDVGDGYEKSIDWNYEPLHFEFVASCYNYYKKTGYTESKYSRSFTLTNNSSLVLAGYIEAENSP